MNSVRCRVHWDSVPVLRDVSAGDVGFHASELVGGWYKARGRAMPTPGRRFCVCRGSNLDDRDRLPMNQTFGALRVSPGEVVGVSWELYVELTRLYLRAGCVHVDFLQAGLRSGHGVVHDHDLASICHAISELDRDGCVVALLLLGMLRWEEEVVLLMRLLRVESELKTVRHLAPRLLSILRQDQVEILEKYLSPQ